MRKKTHNLILLGIKIALPDACGKVLDVAVKISVVELGHKSALSESAAFEPNHR